MTAITMSSKAKPNVWTEARPCPSEPALDGLSLMQILWARLNGLMPGAWSRHFTSDESLEHWRQAWAMRFVVVQLRPDEVQIGLARLGEVISRRDMQFGRVTVEDFIAACRPRLDPEDAFHEAVREIPKHRRPARIDGELVSQARWTEPAVYHAAVAMGKDLEELSWRDIRSRFTSALEKARKEGLPVPPPYDPEKPAAYLPAPEAKGAGKRTIAPEAQKAMISDMLSTLGGRKRITPKVEDTRSLQQREREFEEARQRQVAEAELRLLAAKRQQLSA